MIKHKKREESLKKIGEIIDELGNDPYLIQIESDLSKLKAGFLEVLERDEAIKADNKTKLST